MNKRALVFIVICVLLVAGIIVSIYALRKDNDTEINSDVNKKYPKDNAGNIIHLELKRGEDYTLNDNEDALTEAPESFKIIDSKTMYICDTHGKQLLKYSEGKLSKKVPVNTIGEIIDFDISDDVIYLLEDLNVLTIMDMSGNIKSSSNISLDTGDIESLAVKGSEIYFQDTFSYNYKIPIDMLKDEVLLTKEDMFNLKYTASIENNKGSLTDSSGNTIYIEPTKGYNLIYVVDFKDIGNKSYVKVSEYKEENDEIYMNKYIKLIENSKQDIVYNVVLNKFFTPTNEIDIDDEGNVYQMVVYEDKL